MDEQECKTHLEIRAWQRHASVKEDHACGKNIKPTLTHTCSPRAQTGECINLEVSAYFCHLNRGHTGLFTSRETFIPALMAGDCVPA